LNLRHIQLTTIMSDNLFDFISDVPTTDDSSTITDTITDDIYPINRDTILQYYGKGRTTDKVKEYEPEPEGIIDPQLVSVDLFTIIYAEINRKKIAGHHIDSMNAFYKVGIKQIATKLFTVEGRYKNQRDKTDEDREISELEYKVEFTDINLAPPTTIKYKSGTTQMLTPNMARIKGVSYSAQMSIDASVRVTAIYKNGSTKTHTTEVKGQRIASIPCALGTELCNTFNASRETLKTIEEDPQNPGGYFIIKGGEWAVDNLENSAYNNFHVTKNMYANEIVRGYFISKPGDAFENSFQIVLRYLNTGAITAEIFVPRVDKLEIPYYIIFRVFGMTRDKDIVNNIVYGVDNKDPITQKLLEILEGSFRVEDSKFGPIRTNTNSVEIIEYIGRKITEIANPTAARKDDNVTKYLNNNVLGIFDKYVLPHIGSGAEHRMRKLRYLGHLIYKLLCVNIGVLDQSDRDSYADGKRIHAAGITIAKAFKKSFNLATVQEIRKHLQKDFKTTPFSQLQLGESIKAAINSDDLERMLTKAITTGDKTITIRRMQISNRVSSQTIYHKNDLNVKSILGTISVANSGASKQNERADQMRRVHASYLGYIDVTQSADTGEKVGMTKQLACTASICGSTSSYIIKDILTADPDIILLDDITPEAITEEKLAKVFVNGDWIGCCRKSHNLIHKYRIARRHGDIHYHTTIAWKLHVREILFWTDAGRLMRPLIIVYNNLTEYIKNWREGDRTLQFKQWIKLTKSHIYGLQTSKITMDDLRVERVIEYISPEEQENTFISCNLDNLREHANNIQRMYTHCDIEQAIFGIITLSAPMVNHSNATRNTYYTNHRKQSAGWFALNYPFRIDKNTTLQHYCEKPLVGTFTNVLTYPNGHNCIVALALHGGYNMEDSITVNQNSIDCGAFNASHYNYEKSVLEKGEQFGNPDESRTMDIKKDAIYEHIKGGFISEGTLARKGYVLIVKAAKIPKPIDSYLYIDKSIIYKREEPVYIERVVSTRNDEDAQMAKVKYRANRPLAVGDKLSSMTGNKGIVSNKRARCDLMYSEEDGLVPDLIVNAHSIPTRMAINQVIECLLAQLAANKGCFIDATTFRPINVAETLQLLEKQGIKYGGHKRMYNGLTGEPIDTLIFIGPTAYQRLQKFVIDENYATRTGPTTALTRQPIIGKANDGGLRFGEMEKDVICAHGTMRALHEKFYKDSDGIDIYICRICGNKAVVNEKVGIYKCKYCKDNADIARVSSSWVANLFFSEASAMNVKPRFELAPFTYPRPEK
jgi:DNA-directed RNA polymerase II subunit RPB2